MAYYITAYDNIIYYGIAYCVLCYIIISDWTVPYGSNYVAVHTMLSYVMIHYTL